MKRFNFTVKAINSLPIPASGTTHHRDTTTRGLELIVTTGNGGAGRKTFYFSSKFQGKSIRVLIGTFPEKKIEQVRSKACEYSTLVSNGIDPRDKAQRPRAGLNLQQLFDEYLEKKKRPKAQGGKLTWNQDLAQYNLYLKKDFGHRKINSITRNEIEDLHEEMGERTPTAANRRPWCIP